MQASSCRAKAARFLLFAFGTAKGASINLRRSVIRVLISIQTFEIGGICFPRFDRRLCNSLDGGIKLRGLIIDRVRTFERNERGLISVIVRKCSSRSLIKSFFCESSI